MLNPWTPRISDPERPWPFVDSAFIGTGKNKIVTPVDKIAKVHDIQPDAIAIVNYENAGMHIKLHDQEVSEPGSSIDINTEINMAEVARRQAEKNSNGLSDTEVTEFKWAPPWSHNYDPLALDTLDWVSDKLIELNTKKPEQY